MSATAPRGGSPDAPATRVGGRRGASQALLGPVGRGADPGRRGDVGVVSAVSGRGRRARMRGIGRAEAVLHIRPGPAGYGSAESCGNTPALNAVEILPCAEGTALHMGARTLETNILEKPRNQAENSESTRGGRPSPMCSTTARAGKNPARPGATLRQSPSGRTPPGARPRPNPAGGRPHHADTGPRPWRESLNAPAGAWCSLTSSTPSSGAIPRSLNAPTGAWCSLTRGLEGVGQAASGVSMHLQVRGAP